MMNFNTTNSTFRQLLGNGLSYRVPPFQRDYSWTTDEWDDLWQDIHSLFEDDGDDVHYMGYLVLQTADNKRFDIIDGQQRLTTISVMILACLAHLQDLVENGSSDAANNQKRVDQLRSSYIGYLDPVSLIPQSKLELNRHNNQFYQNYLVPLDKIPKRGLNASEHQLRKAFEWFRERVKQRVGSAETSGRELASFVDTLVDKLFFTVITVTDELNAFKVFETLNARGVRLSATDLLKNYLFSVIHSQGAHEVELKSLEERWERIVGSLGSETFPEFLRVFWNSRNKLVRKSDLFKTIRNRIAGKEKAFELVRDLDHFATVYAALRDGSDSSWQPEEREALAQLKMFNVRQPLAMLLSCHAKFFETNRSGFTKILRATAVVSFRYNVICNLPTHEQERLYNEVANKVFDQTYTNPTQVIDALREVYPNDRLFAEAFADKELRTTNSRNKKVVRYILFEIERQQSEQDFDFESAKYSLEHILPEHPSEAWAYIEESKQEQCIYRLGNMTILETTQNRDLGNKDFATKREIYRKSAFQITSALVEHYDIWDDVKIESRQKRLAKTATTVWKI